VWCIKEGIENWREEKLGRVSQSVGGGVGEEVAERMEEEEVRRRCWRSSRKKFPKVLNALARAPFLLTVSVLASLRISQQQFLEPSALHIFVTDLYKMKICVLRTCTLGLRIQRIICEA
jgi:hypothetical protein